MCDDKNNVTVAESLGNFKISNVTDIDGRSDFKKLNLNSSQKMQISALWNQMPEVMAANELSQTYVAVFPEGVQGTLMKYKDGNFGSPIISSDGKIITHAHFKEVENPVILLNGFGAMAIASGQYFLVEINDKLKKINQSIDEILSFLYGDKKAELLSEISFVKSVYKNYNSIMDHEQQRIATITSLQEAKKVAMKDIEFYMQDLESESKGDDKDIETLVDKIFRIKDCLELSIQLYCISSVLEVYYSQNYDPDYISYLELEINAYVDKCEKRILADFAGLQKYVAMIKKNPLKDIKIGALKKPNFKYLEKRIEEVVEFLGRGGELVERKYLQTVLNTANRKTEIAFTKKGEAYLKVV